jgi:hypothetical protein
MMKVTGKFDNTGKTILTPDIEWSIERAERVSAQAKVFETSM